MSRIPEMPKSKEEWELHWKFYELAIKERDYERIARDRLQQQMDLLQSRITEIEEENKHIAWERGETEERYQEERYQDDTD